MTDPSVSDTTNPPVQDARAPARTTWPDLPEDGLLEQLVQIIAEEGKVAPELVVPEATLESLDLASIDVVSILMGVEEKLNVYLPMSDDLTSARNLAELVEAIVTQMRPDELQSIGPKP